MKYLINFHFLLLFLAAPLFAQRPPVEPINLSYLRVNFVSSGARPFAMGGAFIAAAQDENAAPINPAGLTYLTAMSASLNIRQARTEYKEPQGSPETPDTRRRLHTNNFDQVSLSINVAHGNFTFSLFRQIYFSDRFTFETQQFLTTDEPLTTRQVLGGLGNFPGRDVILDLELVNNGFSIAYKVTNWFSIGATGKIAVFNFKLNEQTFLDPELVNARAPRENSAETEYSVAILDEQDVSPGYSIGFMGKLIEDKLFLGGVVNFNPKYSFENDIFLPTYRLDGLTFQAESPQRTSFDFVIPDSYGFGLYYILNNHLRFTFDVVHVEYSDLLHGNDLNVVADDEFSVQTSSYDDPDGKPDLTIDDETELHFGMEYLFKVPKLGLIPIRFGILTDPDHRIHAAGENPDMNRLYPKGSRRIDYSLGLGLILNSYLKLDGGFKTSSDGWQIIGTASFTIPNS